MGAPSGSLIDLVVQANYPATFTSGAQKTKGAAGFWLHALAPIGGAGGAVTVNIQGSADETDPTGWVTLLTLSLGAAGTVDQGVFPNGELPPFIRADCVLGAAADFGVRAHVIWS